MIYREHNGCKFLYGISVLIVALSLNLTSCKLSSKSTITSINLFSSLEWAACFQTSSPQFANTYNFEPLPKKNRYNLASLTEPSGGFIWLKCDFKIPENLQNEDLGLYIEYLHFSDEVYINGQFSGSYGNFPPNAHSALYEGHYYHFPKASLNTKDNNTILIKVFCQGKSEISRNIILDKAENAKKFAYNTSFWTSKIYIFFIGGMFASFFLFGFLYLWRKNRLNYLLFSLMNLTSIFFTQYFSGGDNPFYFNISNLVYTKMNLCIPFATIFFLLVSFVLSSIEYKQSKQYFRARIILYGIILFLIIGAQNYYRLTKLSIPIIVLTVSQIIFLFPVISSYCNNRKTRRNTLSVLIALIPLVACIIVDIIVRLIFGILSLPFFTILGWQIVIISYLYSLTKRFDQVSKENEYLSTNLQREVEQQTHELSITNELLEDEINKSRLDFQMAAIIQQKFFPAPDRAFIGWDLAIAYDPLSEVSGDLYDYFNIGNVLDGLALFDVSGHGIPASLITMLSKNIIKEIFEKNRFTDLTVSDMLTDINRKIIQEKGSIDNYLTGILLKIENYDSEDICEIKMANGGHPNPLLYKADTGTIEEVIHDETQEQFGAIGINGIAVSFPNISFSMAPGDIFVCFTDGLSESADIHFNQFGAKNIMRVIEKNNKKCASDILKALKDELAEFMGQKETDDDITIIVMKREASSDFIELLE